MATDLAEAAEFRELYWPEGSRPVPRDSFYLRARPSEHERYERLWQFTRDYENLKIVGLFPLKNTSVVDGHMVQVGQRLSPGPTSLGHLLLVATTHN
eukprot:4100788-Alexandrium_andersonii.AAC.1